LLSKSVACSLPAAILLLVYWKHGRLRGADIKPLIPFFLVGLFMAAVTTRLEIQHVGASGREWNFTPLDRCLIAGRALWFYAAKLLWPHPLIFSYPRWERMNLAERPWLIVFPLCVAGIIAALWLLRKRIGRGPLAAVLFFAGTLVPALGFINLFPMRYSFVADHFQYVACIGPIVLAAAGLERLLGRRTALVAADILVALGLLTWVQGAIYQNERTLWENTTQLNPSSWMAWGDLGDQYAALSNSPDLPEDQRAWYRGKARQCYAMLYRLAPDQPISHLKWGILKEYDGDMNAAMVEFAQALREEPHFTLAMNSMGTVLMLQHHPQEAMEYFRRAIDLDPGYAEARVHYGDALESVGDIDGAMEQYSQAAARRPDNVDAQFKLGNLLLTHRPDLAAPHYAAALEVDPQRADIRTNLAVALRAMGWTDAAREQCRQALQIDPNLSQAQQLWKALNNP
jgi:tetratricopeptide (TPR) repeat protein